MGAPGRAPVPDGAPELRAVAEPRLARGRGGGQARQRRRPPGGEPAAAPRDPLPAARDGGARHARAHVAVGVHRGAQGARAREWVRLAGVPRVAARREAARRGVPRRARAGGALADRGLHAGAAARGPLHARGAPDRARRADHRLARAPLQGRAAHDRRRRHRDAGHAGRGDGPPDPPLVLPRALGRAQRPDADEPARVTFGGIALGCGNFGGVGSAPEFFGRGIPEDEAFAIMDRAWAEGIRWFDTGDAYGGGRSESWIGKWRADRGPEGLLLTTKVFHSTAGTSGDTGLAPDRIRRQLESSLERLGVDRVDLYLAHAPDPETTLGETIAAFEALRSEGLVGTWGLSNYDLAGLEEAMQHGRPSLVQNSFSLLERD